MITLLGIKNYLIAGSIAIGVLFGGAYVVKFGKMAYYSVQWKKADHKRKRLLKQVKEEKDVEKRNKIMDCLITMRDDC